MILTNARILTFDAANRVLDSGSVEVRDDGTIGVRAAAAGRLDAACGGPQRPPAHAGADQLPHPSLQHAGARHAAARSRRRRISRRS